MEKPERSQLTKTTPSFSVVKKEEEEEEPDNYNMCYLTKDEFFSIFHNLQTRVLSYVDINNRMKIFLRSLLST
jgi:hypothetical protein